MPCDGVELTGVSPAGRASATVTPVAPSGPLLVTATVNVTFWPRSGSGWSTTFVTTRSASGTLTVADALLLPGVGSYVVALTVAVLVTAMWVVTVATTARVALAPFATVPTVQVPAA